MRCGGVRLLFHPLASQNRDVTISGTSTVTLHRERSLLVLGARQAWLAEDMTPHHPCLPCTWQGLRSVSYTNLTGGIVAIHSGFRLPD